MRKRGVLVGAAVGVLALGGAWLVLGSWYSPEERRVRDLLDKIEVHGYHRTVMLIDGREGFEAAEGIYVGSVVQGDLNQIFSGLGVGKVKDPPPGNDSPDTYGMVWVGTGSLGGTCSYLVHKYNRHREPNDSWRVGADEVALAKAGRLDILNVWVSCSTG